MPNRKPPDPAVPAPKARGGRAKSAEVVPITKAAQSAAAAKAKGGAAYGAADGPGATEAGVAPPKPVARTATPKAGAVPAAKPARASKSGGTLRLKDLTERVEALTGGRKKAVRQTVEAVLTVLGHALMAGDDLNLPPLGRARVSRQRDREDGEILMVRLKRSAADPAKPGKAATRKAAKEALATTPEES